MFERLLEMVARNLEEAGIPYRVIGGQAVLLYGEPRLTKDIDITLGIGPERLAEVLGIAHGMHLQPLVDPETFTRQTFVLPCSDPETGLRVDFIFSVSEYEQQALKRVRSVKMGNAEVRFASLEDVLIHKVVAGRPRDLEDVKSMLLKNHGVDEGYIRRWLGEFSDALGEPYLDCFQRIWGESR